MVAIIGKWSNELQVFWYGANCEEYIAWKGSHQIFVFPCDEYPNPPSEVIQYHKRIETLDDFNEALQGGLIYKVTYD